MLPQWLAFLLVIAAGAVTVWLQARQRFRDEGARARRTRPSLNYARMLGVFLPLVALLTLVQLYIEQPRQLYLVLALVAGVALVLGLVPGEQRHSPRQSGRMRGWRRR